MFEELGGFDAVEKWQEPKIRDKCSLDGKMSVLARNTNYVQRQ